MTTEPKLIDLLRRVYHRTASPELRLWFYGVRHRAELTAARSAVYPSEKGTFSLRAFDRHRCIFVHIPKAAGTSVATSLFGELPYHHTAAEYRMIFGRRDFREYFKFAIVRNPWDRLYSAYSYLSAGGWNAADAAWFDTHLRHLPDFNAFVLDWLEPERLDSHIHFRPQTEFVCDSKGRVLIDHLAYFETLPEDFAWIANRLGVAASLQKINASKHGRYQDAYTPEAAAKVAALYRRDIENFGYDFNGIVQRMAPSGGRFRPLSAAGDARAPALDEPRPAQRPEPSGVEAG